MKGQLKPKVWLLLICCQNPYYSLVCLYKLGTSGSCFKLKGGYRVNAQSFLNQALILKHLQEVCGTYVKLRVKTKRYTRTTY